MNTPGTKTKSMEDELNTVIAATDGAAEVGELIGLVETLWGLLTPEQHAQFMQSEKVKSLLR